MIRRPMLAHWLDVGTRVGVVSKNGSRRGRIKRVYKGEEHPYLIRTDDGHEIRCGLERLVPEMEAAYTPPRIKVKMKKIIVKPTPASLDDVKRIISVLKEQGYECSEQQATMLWTHIIHQWGGPKLPVNDWLLYEFCMYNIEEMQ